MKQREHKHSAGGVYCTTTLRVERVWHTITVTHQLHLRILVEISVHMRTKKHVKNVRT